MVNDHAMSRSNADKGNSKWTETLTQAGYTQAYQGRDTATGLKETAFNKRNVEAIHDKVQEISNVKRASGRERETCRWKD
jgi:hypothetical protein